LNIVSIRGNVDTRIKKIEIEGLHGVVLAAAGMHRLCLNDRISHYIPMDIVLPAPAQGALAIEIRKDHSYLDEIIKSIEDKNTYIQIACERGFLDGVNGSCHIPIGAYCTIKGKELKLTGLLGDEEGNVLIKKSINGQVGNERELGINLAKIVLKELKSYEW
ncbi:MAG TPA: hydroxymethylbilane synthase, partial [Peptostreptococcaceae bacterium]|nr:hydroxymethylbilane synthase [Peptostreptococcaceae bacterium]